MMGLLLKLTHQADETSANMLLFTSFAILLTYYKTATCEIQQSNQAQNALLSTTRLS